MNPDFTRYQELPSLDALSVSVNLTETGVQTESHTSAGARPLLFPLPEGEGQGEGKRTAMPKLAQQNNFPRA